MKKYRLLLALTFWALPAVALWAGPIPDGEYIGFESMPNLSPEEKDTKWFHQLDLIIKGDSVELHKSPMCIAHGKKIYSASDGGFYDYKGTIITKGNKTYLNLLLVNSDYGAVRSEIDPEVAKKYPGYEKWPIREQMAKGIRVRAKPKPFEKEIEFKNGKVVYNRILFHVRRAGEKARW